MGAYTYNLSNGEMEARISGVQGHPQLSSNIEATGLGYMRSCLSKQNKTKISSKKKKVKLDWCPNKSKIKKYD